VGVATLGRGNLPCIVWVQAKSRVSVKAWHAPSYLPGEGDAQHLGSVQNHGHTVSPAGAGGPKYARTACACGHTQSQWSTHVIRRAGALLHFTFKRGTKSRVLPQIRPSHKALTPHVRNSRTERDLRPDQCVGAATCEAPAQIGTDMQQRAIVHFHKRRGVRHRAPPLNSSAGDCNDRLPRSDDMRCRPMSMRSHA